MLVENTSPDTASALTTEDDACFGDLCTALETIGCSTAELESVWSLLAAILHMGNIVCTDNLDVNAAEGKEHVVINSPSIALEQLAELLGVSLPTFRQKLVTQHVKISTRSSITVKRLSSIDAMNNVAALSKYLYARLFEWLVKKINVAHASVSGSSSTVLKANKFIGILDIFGFEILGENSFEQLCINFTNERLQQQFNEYVFDREQALYRNEGLDWAAISYTDNQNVIDLISKKPNGLLILLESQGSLNRHSVSEDAALLNLFNSTYTVAATTAAAAGGACNGAYVKSRFTNDGKFTVKHFAGSVVYQISGFLDKNNDSLQNDLLELMLHSSNEFIQHAIVASEKSTLFSGAAPTSFAASTGGGVGYIEEVTDALNTVALAGSGGSGTKLDQQFESSSVDDGNNLSTATTPVGRSAKKSFASLTVSFQFRLQLDKLLSTLKQTAPNYIKCIKPNKNKVSGEFDAPMVLQQLRYSGALEVVRIRQEGFPVSMSFQAFFKSFEILATGRQWQTAGDVSTEQAKVYCATLLREVFDKARATDFVATVATGAGGGATSSPYQLGHTKVFIRNDAFEHMHLAVSAFIFRCVAKFQALIRCIQAVRRYRATTRSLKTLQCAVRVFNSKTTLTKKRTAARLAEQRRLELLAQQKAEEVRLAALRKAEVERLEALQVEAEKAAELARIEAEKQAELARIEAEKQAELARNEAERQAEIEAEEERQRAVEAAALAVRDRHTRLHLAAESGDVVTVAAMLEEFPEDYLSISTGSSGQDSSSSACCTLLHSAIKSGSVALVRFLNPTAEDVTVVNEQGNNALHIAAAAVAHPTVRGSLGAPLPLLLSMDELVCGGGPRVQLMRILAQIVEKPPPTAQDVALAQAEQAAAKQSRLSQQPVNAPELQQTNTPRRKFARLSIAAAPTKITVGAGGSRRKSIIIPGGTSTVVGGSYKAPAAQLLQSAREAEIRLEQSAAQIYQTAPRRSVFAATGVDDSDNGPIDKTTPEGAAKFLEAAAKASTTTVLRKGWLSKKGEGRMPIWRKRFIVLTNHSLLYYRNEKDSNPTDFLSFRHKNDLAIRRSPTHATALDIVYLGQQSAMKNRSKVSLMAESEQELQVWLNMIKAVANVRNPPLRGADSSLSPPVAVNPALRLAYLNQKNNAGETPLHILASHDVKEYKGENELAESYQAVLQALCAASWLTGNGASIHEREAKKLTALFRAVMHNNDYMAQLLAMKGSNPALALKTLPPLVAATAHKLLLQDRLNELYQRHVTHTSGFQEAPLRLRGFSYLSLVILSQTIFIPDYFIAPDLVSMRRASGGTSSSSGLDEYFAPAADEYFLSVTVYNHNGHVAEAKQATSGPVNIYDLTLNKEQRSQQPSRQVWLWLDAFHMTVPLDNVEEGSYVVLELLKQSIDVTATAASANKGRKPVYVHTPVLFAKFDIDKKKIDTEMITLEFCDTTSQSAMMPDGNTPYGSLHVETIISQRSGAAIM